MLAFTQHTCDAVAAERVTDEDVGQPRVAAARKTCLLRVVAAVAKMVMCP